MDLSVFSDKKDDPIVINFAQKHDFTGNFLVGTLVRQEELPEGVPRNPWPKQKNGISKEIVYWKPHDATTVEGSNQIQDADILSDNLMVIGPGVVSPRKVYFLMPDKMTEIPDELMRPTNSANPQKVKEFNKVIAQFYRQRDYEETLKTILENEDLKSKIEELVKNDVIDDALLEKRINEHERVKDIADSGRKSDSEN